MDEPQPMKEDIDETGNTPQPQDPAQARLNAGAPTFRPRPDTYV